ncbi:hypothetical protein AALP_AA7G256100 [Arabis alpina]|uniref:Uncharacterized protein n=1 Tax=Arabis alpina TaxID=50452 RepID=A0A087GKJ7_ARAAL|nr:hypothetical protein AALP_AA7G256100 [Arabis alpina]
MELTRKALLVNAEAASGASASGVSAGDGVGDGGGAKPIGFGGEAIGEIFGDLECGDMVGGVISGTGGVATGEGVSAVGVIAGEGDSTGGRNEIGAGAGAGA